MLKRQTLSKKSVQGWSKAVVIGCISLALLMGSVSFRSSGAEKVKMGSLMALTGGLAQFGKPIVDGVRLAVNDLNEAGGVLDKKIKLIVKDTQSKRGPARDAASKLVNIEQVPVIIGALSSGSTVAASAVTSANEVVLISPSGTSNAISGLEDNGYTFRTCLADKFQGEIQAKLAENIGYETVSVIYVNNPYGKGLAQLFKKKFEELGGEVTAMVPYPVDLPSYGGEAQKAIKGSPDAVNLIGYPEGGNKLLDRIISLGYEGDYLFPDGMKGEGVTPGPACPAEGPIEEQYLEGSFGTSPSAGALKTFEKDYKEKYGPSAVPFRAQAYDATVLAAFAIQMAGEADGPAIRDHLKKVANPPGVKVGYGELDKAFTLLKEGKDINWQGVSSNVTFTDNGDMATGTIVIWNVEDCKVRNIWYVDVT